MNLPNIYQNNNLKLNETRNTYYSKVTNNIKNNINIKDKINNLFKQTNYVYKINVIITLNNKTIEETIIGKTKTNLITINNTLIPINDIIDIHEKK